MSKVHPIVAVTGSAGSGTTTIRHAFSDIFHRRGISAAFVDGESFHRYDRETMAQVIAQAQVAGLALSHFGPDVNLFEQLEALFAEYGRNGSGTTRRCVTEANCGELSQKPGTFTPWEPLPPGTDLLFYEGLHGGVMARTWTRRQLSPSHNPIVIDRRSARHDSGNGVDVAQHVDLLLGVVPVVNLEWIQKIHRDTRTRGYSVEAVTDTILRRMRDYVNFIVPQFSVTDINFQRVPVVDTSNPFMSRDVPAGSESIVVIRFRDPQRFNFPALMRQIHGSFMSRPNTLVIPGSYIGHALEVICSPLIYQLCEK
ncbi:MAG: phosphoribulokinase [Acidiferrobacterales bacterium]